MEYNAIKNAIYDGENILWSGKPLLKGAFRKFDLRRIPMFVLWLAASVLMLTLPVIDPLQDIAMKVLVILCFIYYSFGRIIMKNYRKKKSFYAITDRRVLWIIEKRDSNKNFVSQIPLTDVKEPQLTLFNDGSGTIVFGKMPKSYYTGMNSGLESYRSGNSRVMPAFFDIENPNEVFSIFEKAQKEALANLPEADGMEEQSIYDI
ncbi:MAG: hypothetical protein GX222_03320 [Ruminococcaceae bacterium]|nr:hypothetical protein [Oscillospiraceae bacterium]